MPELFEIQLETNKGSLRAVSPIDVSKLDLANEPGVLIVHPGMGKAPEHLKTFMRLAKEADYIPIGFDTRWAEPDAEIYGLEKRRRSRNEQLDLRNNPDHIDPTAIQGWYAQRRVIALDQGIEQLGIKHRSYFGHSDGARICALNAFKSQDQTDQLVLVNPAGFGGSWHAYRRLTNSNIHEGTAALKGEVPILPLIAGGLASVTYAIRKFDLVLQEKRVLQPTNLWSNIDDMNENGIEVIIATAWNDYLVSSHGILCEAVKRPSIKSLSLPGRHTNIYNSYVSSILLSQMGQPKSSMVE